MNARALTLRGHMTARRAANSSAMDVAARWGFVARGVIYLLVGILALQIAFGDGGSRPTAAARSPSCRRSPWGP